jgi:hypothetical protein
MAATTRVWLQLRFRPQDSVADSGQENVSSVSLRLRRRNRHYPPSMAIEYTPIDSLAFIAAIGATRLVGTKVPHKKDVGGLRATKTLLRRSLQ